jgi:starch phosphorylase
MLHDQERLRRILTDPDRPVQLVIAGKAHPADEDGKKLIQQLVRFTADPEVRGRMVFLPDYDIAMAQKLYPGTDVWLNNPLRPLEACGTSGMKAALNGALNLSILDGWWDEYYDGENGWAIPSADAAGDSAERDALEAEALYDLIENHVVPQFYDRNNDGIPERWVQKIRHTLATLSPALSADRMVRQYVERLYVPATALGRRLRAEDFRAARELAAWKATVQAAWPDVAVDEVESGLEDGSAEVGESLTVRARVRLGGLEASDVSVQLVCGRSAVGGELADTLVRTLEPAGCREADAGGADSAGDAVQAGDAVHFTGGITLEQAGRFGYTVRVVPSNRLLLGPAELALVSTAG